MFALALLHSHKWQQTLMNGLHCGNILIQPPPSSFIRLDLTRFNKIATQGAPQMAVDKEANSLSRVYSYYSKFNLRLFYV